MLEWVTSIPDKYDYGDYGIFVGNLPTDITAYHLKECFMDFYAWVKDVKVVIDEHTGQSKGYGFVKFADKIEYLRSIKEIPLMFFTQTHPN